MPVGLPLLDRAVWSEPREPIHRRDTMGKQGSGCLSCAWDPDTASRSQGNCSDSNVLRDSRHASGRGWHLNFETNLRRSSQHLFKPDHMLGAKRALRQWTGCSSEAMRQEDKLPSSCSTLPPHVGPQSIWTRTSMEERQAPPPVRASG